ncbi:hypothetical protein [uncultured Alsobacter sp.]|uniref:hypothetical protein n=1 Tax=uncultured Alsobacter sp. TaxID=1748258 RepID=UPI0025CCA0B4|nr:hypothetical protein [uncultured Alsobacter sp.]
MTHTSGPWIVRGDDGTPLGCAPAFADVAIEDGARVADGAAVDWPFFVRQDRGFAMGEIPLHIATGIQRDSDARLIAAAPEMLALLKRIERDLSRGVRATLRDIDDMRATIAKAEGR